MQSPTGSPNTESTRKVLVVAVGASAGGIAAVTELLGHVGTGFGMAFVMIHHLDPGHRSSLPEIFARATSMPVSRADNGMQLSPDHVYVTPESADLSIEDGRLMVVPRDLSDGPHLPIDRFFESLAADRGAGAVGVVLTGTGSDGAQGVRAIKAAGGITFAQDDSAEHRGMPHSAISTGCIDFVQSAAGIAEQLLRLSQRAHPPEVAADDDVELMKILTALRKAIGVDYSRYKLTTVRRRVQRRVAVHGMSTLREYAALLARDSAEMKALAEEILVHVTCFFRDPELFEALHKVVFPKLMENRERDSTIRVWIPACSTGEEVYSVAIALLDFLEDAAPTGVTVKLFGTDISLAAIAKARVGRYPASIERDVSKAHLKRYFTQVEGAYQIRSEVRDLCVFARQDATADPPFSSLDLISCRNLMIYLSPALQERVLPVLHYALREPGFLVLGSSETTRSFPGFTIVDGKAKVYARTSAAPRVLFDFSESRWGGTDVASSTPSNTRQSESSEVHREADRLVLSEFAPPGLVVTEDMAIVQFRGRVGPFLAPTPGVASFELLRMVREELRFALRQMVDDARAKRRTVRRTESFAETNTANRTIELEVIPFGVGSSPQRYLVILFRDVTPDAAELAAQTTPPPKRDEGAMAQELASTRAYLQSVVEQVEASNEELRAANEEVVSSNEELRSTNEELQMAKEELQSANEELRIVNEELSVRNAEGLRLNDDLTNVLSSVEIPILIMGRGQRLRRMTPAAARVMGLAGQDLDLPLRDLGRLGRAFDLEALNTQVIEGLVPVSRVVQDAQGRWYQMTLRPYLTADKRIDGTVMTLIDIDELKQAEQLCREAQLLAERVIDTVREGLVVLDADGRVRSANRAFLQASSLEASQVNGRRLDELGGGAWNVGALVRALDELDDAHRVEDMPLEVDIPGVGRRALVITARHVEATTSVLVAIRDVTEIKRATELVQDYQAKLQRMALDASVIEERERRRIAVALHDRIGQALVLAEMKLSDLREVVTGDAKLGLEAAIALLDQAVNDARGLTFELSPPVLYDLGLGDALAWLADDLLRRYRLRVTTASTGEAVYLNDAMAGFVFRAIRELLMNVQQHAGTATASVSLHWSSQELEIEVRDHGVGFSTEAMDEVTRTGVGLFGVREHLARFGGSMRIESQPSRGTRVVLNVPLLEEPPAST